MSAVNDDRLSDLELRRAQLFLNDPYVQDRIVWKVQDSVQLVDLVNTYSYYRWPKEKVGCIVCGAARHKNGYTGKLSDGSYILAGSKCGEEIFGENWIQATKRLRNQRRRQHLLLKLDALHPQIDAVIAEFRGWRPTMDKLRASRRRFARNLGPLWAALISAANTDEGRLTVFQRVRDLAAEEKASGNGSSHRYKWIEVEVHRLASGAYFASLDPLAQVDQAILLLREIQEVSRNTDVVSLRKMREYDQRMREALIGLENSLAMHRASFEFFGRDLAPVAAWASKTHHVEGSYEVNGKEIHWIESGASMCLPPRYQTIGIGGLDVLRGVVADRRAA